MSKWHSPNLGEQLPLEIALRDTARFENYFTHAQDQAALFSLQECVKPAGLETLYLWGGAGVGKTHLLQAACHFGAQQHRRVGYLPLRQSAELSPQVLDGLEALDFLAIDDVHCVRRQTDWELAIFSLINRLRERGGHLAFSAIAAPNKIGFQLADLVSRLTWGPVYHLSELNDEQKIQALQLRANHRGMELTAEVARYLIHRIPRDMSALFKMLETLDQASLAAQRKLTIPFIKQQLSL